MRQVMLVLNVCLLVCGLGLAQPKTMTITDGPKVEGVGNNWAVIAWSTNEASSSMLLYGTDQSGVQRSSDQSWPTNAVKPSGSNPGLAQAPWGGTNHRIKVTNLQPGTTYYFAVRSTAGRGSGGMSTSNVSSFTTK